MTFAELNLAPAILQALHDCGYAEPTPIQAQTIPVLLAGRDVIASAPTGTGKTAAFVLPALQRLADAPRAADARQRGAALPRVLVLVPTRELAQQVAQQVTRYGRALKLRTVCLYGGAPFPVQFRELQHGVDVLVATPGRLLDHLGRRRVELSRIEMLVLDEADRMLDMGFAEDVEAICAGMPDARQTVLFSATLDGPIARLAAQVTRDAERIAVRREKAAVQSIEQRVHFADDRAHKHQLLDHVLADAALRQSIVFTATKREAEALAIRLCGAGHHAAALHGDMNQRERNRTIDSLKRGGVRTLVATDVAARGIDVAGITHVINFDLPRQAEDYVHRIGRTGRAGASGVAVSFASPADRGALRQIERFTGTPIAAQVVPGLEPRARPAPAHDARKRDGWRGGASRHGAGPAAPRTAPGAGRFRRDKPGSGRTPR